MTERPDRHIFIGSDDGLRRLSGSASGSPRRFKALDLRIEPRRSVRALTWDPQSAMLYLGFGHRGSGLLRSPDLGRCFDPLSGWPEERQAWSVGVRANGALMVGSQPPELWELGSGGWSSNEALRAIPERSQWDFIAPPYEAHILDINPHPSRPGRWLAAVEQGGLISSHDDGQSWQQSSPVWDAHRVIQSEHSAIAITGEGSFLSEDDAVSWRALEGPSGYATGLCRDQAGAFSIAVGGAGVSPLWRSTDDGQSWRPEPCGADLPAPAAGVHALAADPSLAGVLYYGAEDKVWRLESGEAQLVGSELGTIRRILVIADPYKRML